MSGIEIAGLVLGALPIAIKATKSYSEGLEEGKKIFRTKNHDEIKRDLFEDLYQELVLFNRHVRKVLQVLPDVSQERCHEVLNHPNQQNWQEQSDIVQALRSYLGTDFEAFSYAVREVYFWINGILEDKSLTAQGAIKDDRVFLETLKTFTDASRAKKTESEFKARLHLWRREGRLKEQVKKLKKWRKFVEKITDNTLCRQLEAVSVGSTSPAQVKIPRLSKGLYLVLSESWKCDQCPGTHRAKICLQGQPDLHRRPDPDNVKYKLLFSTPHGSTTGAAEEWRETTITVKCFAKKGKVGFSPDGTKREQVKHVCCTVSNHRCIRGNKLCFTAEHFEDDTSTTMYRARDYFKSNLEFPTTAATDVTLKDALAYVGQQLDLTQKRTLALALAYGMLTLAGSPWLQERWSKEHIQLFRTHSNGVCHTQPFVASDMKQSIDQRKNLPPEVMHPLPPILSLGILLLELETGEAIESMRTDDDYVSPGVVDDNTDFTAAIREAENRTMTSPQYKEAILACLDEKEWDDGQGDEANMLQERVRKRVYEQIIEKLEADLEALTA